MTTAKLSVIKNSAAILMAGSLLAGCMVGPNFKTPDLSPTAGYTAKPVTSTVSAASTGGSSQAFAYGSDIPADWWALFKSKRLNVLIEQSMAANPSIDAAKASLREARETELATRGGLFPSISASASAERAKSGSDSSGAYTLYNSSVDVSYDLDLFGGTRRSMEAANATTQYQAFELEAAYLTLTSNLVTGVIQEASLREQIRATEEIIKSESELLEIQKNKVAVGAVSRSDQLQQEASLAETKASLPTLQKQLEQQRNALAALAGKFPNSYDTKPFSLGELTLPRQVPVSLPSDLVRQRPDIRAAEAQLHQASAEVGVATANMYPQITLSAGLPASVDELASLLNASALGWNIAASVTQPIFQGGTLFHNKKAAEAAYDVALANYKSTLLSAFEDVANALRAVKSDADSLRARVAAEKAASQSLDLLRQQYEAGAIDYTSVLTAQQTYESAKINRVTAQALRYSDTTALLVALGGGWWNKPNAQMVASADTSRQAKASR